MALSNYDIETICNNLRLDLRGVFSKDRLPKHRRVGSYYVNLEDFDDGEGSHWVMFRIFDNGKAIYFDPFGVLPPKEVQDFLLPFKPFATSNRHIQDNKSTKCGYFCIACDYFFTYDAIKKRDVDENFDDFLNMFSTDKLKNDRIVMEYLRK